MNQLLSVLQQARVFDLAQPYFPGMPHFPTHPPFLYGMTKRHGDYVTAEGVSSAADAIALGTHTGTHIDSLCHFSCSGNIFGGREVAPLQSDAFGIAELSVDTIAPIVRRGVLLDVATLMGVEVLEVDFEITASHLDQACQREGIEVRSGDVVLIRTGWARYWPDAKKYITGGQGSEVRGPGPGLEAAKWLSGRGIFAAGSDTVPFEKTPGPGFPVHVHLLVESGIYIFEVLQLEDLAKFQVYEFAFVAAPLKVRGATGAPVRPIAIA